MNFQKKEYNVALDYFKQSLKIKQEIGDKKGESSSNAEIGRVYKVRGELNKAKGYIKKSLKIAQLIDNKSLVCDNYLQLSEIFEQNGESKLALKYYKLFTAEKDSLFSVQNMNKIAELETKFESEKKVKEIEILTKEKEIQKLEIEKQESKVKLQKTTINLFIVVSVVVIIITFLIYSRSKLKQKNRQNELIWRNVEIEQRLLRSQMNPHFIFNSLNSIQYYVSKNDSYMAESYLSKFARLIRSILEHSRQSYVPISDDCETLKLYMELEKLRFSDKFDYDFIVSDEIDIDFTKIPPMLIQPFVENSIIHGILQNSVQGKIKISLNINKSENQIICNVYDNGIGRGKSMELKMKSIQDHKSLGMAVTAERIELLNKKGKDNYSVKYFDLMDTEGNSTGTNVELKIPFVKD